MWNRHLALVIKSTYVLIYRRIVVSAVSYVLTCIMCMLLAVYCMYHYYVCIVMVNIEAVYDDFGF